MSETEAKLEAVLDKFEVDVAEVSQQMRVLLSPVSIDTLSATKPDSHKAVPYAMSAYALSSLLFAYLRSEGQDTALVMPELGRVKDKMERLGKRLSNAAASSTVSKPNKRSASPSVEPKRVNKHTHFEQDNDSQPKKKNKKSKKSKKE